MLFVLSLFAEFIANDRPLLVRYDGALLRPGAARLQRGRRSAATSCRPRPTSPTPSCSERIDAHGWMIWPPIPYPLRHAWSRTCRPRRPRRPRARNLLGTDDQARDVLARVIYGFRISVLFGFTLTVVVLGRRHRRRRGAGLLWRADRPAVPALHRDLVGHAAALPAHHPRQHHHARLLDAADLPAAVLLDGR